jgi:hypothetical protein
MLRRIVAIPQVDRMADLGTPEREGVFLVAHREEQTGARGAGCRWAS